MNYGQLPNTTGTGQPQPSMLCDDCGSGPYSAERGDYFMFRDDEPVTCGECDGPMVLVREVRYFERVDS